MAHWESDVDEWGIPKNINSFENYGFTQNADTGEWDFEKWDINRWKWEFLRRRGDYRQAYRDALASLAETPSRPPEVTDDLLDCYPYGEWPFPHQGAKKFGLSHFFDPRQSDWVAIGPHWSDSGLLSAWSHQVNLEWHDVPVVFDISRPIQPQLDEAEDILKETAHLVGTDGLRKANARTKKWPGYLLALDAQARGETQNQIKCRFAVSNSRDCNHMGEARDALNAAHNLFWGES